jgi:beta-glucanase (GH16 family)
MITRKKISLLFILVWAVLTGNTMQAQEALLPGYQLLWADEFDGAHYDYNIWIPLRVGAGYINHELQCYVSDTKNIFNRDGCLVLKLIKETSGNCAYTSGELMSRSREDRPDDTGAFLYGLVEARFKLPEGKGAWPAIWMMPKYSIYGNWPRSGEIDIFEWLGNDPSRLHSGAIMAGKTSGNFSKNATAILGDDEGEHNFHTIAFEWTPESLKWFLDGNLYLTYLRSESDGDRPRLWPFDSEFYLILNYAYGGDWGAQGGIDDSKLPQEFIIDYVRVYQKASTAINETKNDLFSMKVISNEILAVNAKSSQTTMDIFSVIGKKHLSLQTNTPDTEINISSLPKGIYALSVRDGNSRYSGKFIKE